MRTSIVFLVALLAALPGCPANDTCGPSDAPGDGLSLTGTDVDVRYHMMVASQNNDCPDPDAPDGVISLTISAVQVGGGEAITFCVPRPDLFADPLPLGTGVNIVDVDADTGTCTFARNPTGAPTGTANAEGLCGDGADPAGFALVVHGTVAVDRTCGGSVDTLQLALDGVIAVAVP